MSANICCLRCKWSPCKREVQTGRPSPTQAPSLFKSYWFICLTYSVFLNGPQGQLSDKSRYPSAQIGISDDLGQFVVSRVKGMPKGSYAATAENSCPGLLSVCASAVIHRTATGQWWLLVQDIARSNILLFDYLIYVFETLADYINSIRRSSFVQFLFHPKFNRIIEKNNARKDNKIIWTHLDLF